MIRTALMFAVALGLAHAAGTVQQADPAQLGQTNTYVVAFYWTGDASSGSIPVTTAQLRGCCAGYFFTQVEIVPGSPAPTSGYSLAVNSSAGVDILGGAAASLSAVTPQAFAAAASAAPLSGTFSLAITGQSVAAAKGTVFVYLQKPGTVNLATLGRAAGSTSTANWLTIANPPFVDPRVTNFAAQSVQALTAAVPATVTLSPGPVGVAGTHTAANHLPHLLYLSGGAGAAEAVQITGGTCTGTGGASCTIQFTPANNHTGSNIQSATTGVQEAIYSAGATGSVRLPCTNLELYGTLTIPDGYGTSMRGCGMRETTFRTHFTTGDVIVYDYFSAAGSVDTGDYQILDFTGTTHTTGVGLRIRYRADGDVSRILMSSMYDSIWAEGAARVNFHDFTIYNYHYGVTVTCNGVSGATCSSQVDLGRAHVITMVAGGHGIHIQDQTTGVIITNPFVEGGISPVGAGNSALYINVTSAGPTNEIVISGGFLDSHTSCATFVGNGATYNNNSLQIVGVHIACSNYGVQAGSYIQDVTLASNWISAVGSGTPGNAGAISLLANTRGVKMYSNQMNSDGQACFYLTGASSDIDGVANSCGTETQPSNAINISAALTGARFKSNTFSSSSTVYTAGVAPTGLVMSGNTGIDDVIPAVASAGTLAFPVNPVFTLTGTTGVTAVTVPFAAGARFTFIATNATPGAWTAGATIANTFTPTQNVPVNCVWDGTKVGCKP